MLFSLYRGSARGKKEDEEMIMFPPHVSDRKEGAANQGIEFANNTRLFPPVKAIVT